jgi:protein-L-isoaspartate(D-aspartate) O-methyltransferase
MLDSDFARRQMIEQQVRAWAVLDAAVLETMGRVPREAFVPPAYRELAFADLAVPIGHGQHMLTPTLEGRILQSLELRPDDAVLEVGTGSGFFAACLGALTRSVTSLEIFADLADAARTSLARSGASNVTVANVDAFGREYASRYDVIVLTGSLPVYDPRFESLLAEGGRLFAVVGQGHAMDARRITCTGPGQWQRQSLFETAMDPLVHAPEPPKFIF